MTFLSTFTQQLLCATAAVSLTLAAAAAETRIIDGDTIQHQGERIRIWSLNCAERNQDQGIVATEQLRRLADGNRIILQPVEQAQDERSKCRKHDSKCKRPGYCDCYGRTVSRVLVQRTSRAEFFTLDAACYMIQGGWCAEYTHYSRGYYGRCKP